MTAAPTPVDEELRLKALHELNVLDTLPEQAFDDLTFLASYLCQTPIALVSLVDRDRQWFKSRHGLDAEETPRAAAFCAHSILRPNGVMQVPDASEDERFADNPLVVDAPGIRFYAGCPLSHLDRNKLGTLCIIDTKPRHLDGEDLAALKDLAELAERELAAVQLATLDELTKISNRRGFENLAQNSLNLCARQRAPASLVFFDLNDFKEINDECGHAEGDRALVAFAEQMKHTFRDSDVFARLAGDEFVVLLTNATSDLAQQAVARFRDNLDSYNREADRGYDISFADGVVTVGGGEHYSVGELLARADTLMYQRKRSRRGDKRKAAAA